MYIVLKKEKSLSLQNQMPLRQMLNALDLVIRYGQKI